MKKIIITLAALSCASCAVMTTTSTYADITLYDMTGKVLDHWDNALVNSEMGTTATTTATMPIKTGGGLAFVDASGVQRYISGGIIIADDIRSNQYSQSEKKTLMMKEAEGLIGEYNAVKKDLEAAEKELKQYEKGSAEYETCSEKIKDLKKVCGNLKNTLYNKYRYNVGTKTFM